MQKQKQRRAKTSVVDMMRGIFEEAQRCPTRSVDEDLFGSREESITVKAPKTMKEDQRKDRRRRVFEVDVCTVIWPEQWSGI